jgi:N-methylhydantoinase A
MDAEGTAFVPLDESSVLDAIAGVRETACQAVAVCLLWSTVNSAHELRIGALLDEHAPGIPYTLSHQLNPIVREYRRASSTAIDASLKPLMQAFLATLREDLTKSGFNGNLLVSTSFGGSWRPAEMIDRPIYSVGSGPSMAPVAALTYGAAELSGHMDEQPDLLVCDTGGTTFDVGLISGGEIHYSAETWLGGRWVGHITGTRSVDVRSIGAGGGSIVWIDSGGLLHVGPKSAGSDPGPACYGMGGTAPTVTDAALLLGYLDASNFLGGRLVLDPEAARQAYLPIAEQLKTTVEEAAAAAMVIASENIVGAIREITISQGIDPRDMTIVAGGGASGFNIIPIARELGCGRVLLPTTAGVLSAYGALHSDVISEFSVSQYSETRNLDLEAVNAALASAGARADEFLNSLHDLHPLAECKQFYVDARYRQQVWELTVPLAEGRLAGAQDVAALEDAFHTIHERVFAVSEPGQYLECLVWKARATAELVKPLVTSRRFQANGQPRPSEIGPVFFPQSGMIEAPRYDGELLSPDASIAGPAVIREPTTTLVVYPGSRVTVTKLGNYMIETMAPAASDGSAARQEVLVP